MAYGGGGGFRRGGGGFGRGPRRFGRFPREMHKITCSECGKEAEVPFKPREGTPVYCRECYFKKKGITPRQPEGQPEGGKEAASEDEEVETKEKDGVEEESEESESGSEEEF